MGASYRDDTSLTRKISGYVSFRIICPCLKFMSGLLEYIHETSQMGASYRDDMLGTSKIIMIISVFELPSLVSIPVP